MSLPYALRQKREDQRYTRAHAPEQGEDNKNHGDYAVANQNIQHLRQYSHAEPCGGERE